MPAKSPAAAPATNVQALRPRDHENAGGTAVSWLAERHRKGWRNSFEALLELWHPEDAQAVWELDDDSMTMVSINAGEWLIARGQIHARGGLREINSYLLSAEGPYFTPGQRAWIAQLRAQPLRLYRVTDVRPGQGMTLLDELDAQAEPQRVRERSGSRTAEPGMLMGARIMRTGSHEQQGEGALELSGAVYPFSRLHEPQLLDRLSRIVGADAEQLHDEDTRDLLESAIARAWLAQWLEPPTLPQFRDAATGEAMLLVTDHYGVVDAAALAAALALQGDVSGDATQGWVRLEAGVEDHRRIVSAVNPGRHADRVEVFHRTQRLADEGRIWFEALAGPAVKHLTREITDPAGSLASADAAGAADAPKAGARGRPNPNPELDAQMMEEILQRHYANWCDEPIPLLRELTPRQAIQTASGLERVKGLLRMYESRETEAARDQGRPAVSYQFLWEALGINR